MKKIISLLLLVTCMVFASCGTSADDSSVSIELTAYDSICFEKMDLEEIYQPTVVDKFLAMKYGKDKMRWYDSTHAVYWVLDSIEHEDMIKSITRDAVIQIGYSN